MAIRLSSNLILPAGLAIALGAFLVIDRTPAAGSSTAAAAPAETAAGRADPMPDLPEGTARQLPPNHPPIGAAMSPHGSQAGAPGEGDAPAISWQVPAGWKVLANPSAMRLATYGVGDSTELTVSRAGGSVDANIDRWVGQFEGSPRTERQDRTVHGMKVAVVRITGTFTGGGGMAAGASAESHAGWTMLAAIVPSSGAPYFFKLLGPSDQVDGARAAFEHMLDGITPRT